MGTAVTLVTKIPSVIKKLLEGSADSVFHIFRINGFVSSLNSAFQCIAGGQS